MSDQTSPSWLWRVKRLRCHTYKFHVALNILMMVIDFVVALVKPQSALSATTTKMHPGACSQNYLASIALCTSRIRPYRIVISMLSSIWANGVNKLVKERKTWTASAMDAGIMYLSYNNHVCMQYSFKDYYILFLLFGNEQQKVCASYTISSLRRFSVTWIGKDKRCVLQMQRCIPIYEKFGSRPLLQITERQGV